jgi:thiamine-monophosphate kinase
VQWALDFARGFAAECEKVGAHVVGGDVTRSDQVVIAVTVLGQCTQSPVLRSGAQPGDVLALAGRQGWAAGGLAVLGRGFRSPVSVVAAHRRPEPPYAEGPHAAELGATAMVDVSDGLVADLGHVARASGVAVSLSADAFHVPQEFQDTARALSADPLHWLLGGGEDHALAACFPPDVDLPMAWSVVGRVEAGEGVLVDGTPWTGPSGWTSF